MVTFQLFNEKSKYNLFEFEFLQTLGSGSFANVKLVKEKKTGKLFALKMVRITNSKTTNAEIYNIKCEIFIHRKLDHPNIIKFHDYIQYDSGVYLVLDYTENGNLYTYLHRKKILPEKEVFRFFHQTCLAVQYLHQNDVLHRDIKPENLLLDKDLNIKLCDFGWATQRIQDKRLTFCGTYEYMAPEIAYKRPYDYKVDIWSLGILLYELIHGEPPYKGRSLPEIYKSFTRGLVKFNANIHPEAKDLIQKILKQNPNDRLSLAQILTHPWVRYNLSKEENVPTILPSIPQQKILFHSHSLPPEVTDTTPTTTTTDAIERHSKENYYEPRTATHAQTKTSQYDNWSEYFKGNQTDIVETSRLILDCSEAGKVFDKNNKTAPEVKDDSMTKILYSSNSNKELNNIPFKPVVENAYMLPEPPKRRSPSPKSAINTGVNAQTPNLVRTPEKSCENKNKIFVNNIFSPSFKSKLTNVIRQLSIQTPSNQGNQGSKTINSAASSKNVLQQINQNTPLNQSNQASSPLAKAFSIQLEKENQKKYSDPKEDYTQQVTSPHFDFFAQDVYQFKSEHHISNTMDDMKLNFTEHVYHHSISKEFPLAPSSSAATTRTNTLDLSHGNEIRSPFERSSKEATEQYRYFPPESIKENLKTSPALRANSKQTDLEEYLQSQASKKAATKPKGMHEPNIVRYHIPINSIMTPNNGQTNKDKQNFLGYHEK